MSYPENFHRLVISGTLNADNFATTLSIVPSDPGSLMGMPEVDATLLAAVSSAVKSWWPGASSTGTHPYITSAAAITSVKLNSIGPDGRYSQDETMEDLLTTPVAGGFTAVRFAPQLTLAHTLETGIIRGLAARGRMFLPPSAYIDPGTDGRSPASAALNSAKALVVLLNAINDVYDALSVGDGSSGRVGVASNTRTGAFREVTAVSVGRVIDTIRSRRNKLDEDRQEWAVTP